MKTFTLGLLTLAVFSLHAADNPAFVTIALDQTGGRALESYGAESAWAVVPTGHWPYDGVPFNVMTKLQLHGNGNARENRFYPARVMGIPVRQRLARLHLLHGGDFTEPNSRPIASVRVNYAGGSNYTFFISYGVHVRTWRKDRGSKDTVTDPNSSVVWTGNSADGDKANVTHRLYKSSFNVPSGMVETIDLFSLFGTSSEVILAMTGEAPGAASVVTPPPSADDSKYRESIVVKIANQNGEPMLGARVRGTAISERDSNLNRGTLSATLGRMDDTGGELGSVAVDFPANAKNLRLIAQANEFVPEAINLTRGADGKFRSEVSARLIPGIHIGGVVRDPAGRPLAKAKVEITRYWPFTSLFSYDEITTDAQGRWTTHEVPESLRNLRFDVTHASYHHGRYEFHAESGDGGLTRDALLGSRAAFQLERKISIKGTLKDELGQPLTNVTVWLMRGGGGSGQRTDRRGAFTLNDVDHAPGFLKVEDPAFAPLLMPIDPTQETAPLKLVMTKGAPLRGQFIEFVSTNSPESRPVSGLTLSLSQGENEMVRWTGKSDAEGRFEWPHAPEGEVRILVWGPSRNQRAFTGRAGQTENKFDLSLIMTANGVVQDMETKKTVTDLTVTPGQRVGDDRWNWQAYRAVRGQAGAFTFQERYMSSFVKIEAPGYQPTAFPMPDGGALKTNVFTLRRGGMVKGVAKFADGAPAAGAQVALVGEMHLGLGHGRFSTLGYTPAERVNTATTDSEGRFELPSHFMQRVVLVHSNGYAETTLSNLGVNAEVKLESYGIIEGMLLEGRTPVSNAVIGLEAAFNHYGLYYDTNFTARTDAEGKFRFTYVPPGTRWLARKVETHPQNSMWSHRTSVEVVPGATTKANVGGTGRAVIGQLVVPDGVTIDWNRSSFSIYDVPRIPSFRTTEELRAWQATPEGRESVTANRNYAMLATPDGRLRAEDIPPGRHRLQMQLRAPPAPGASPNSFGPYIQGTQRDFDIEPQSGGRSDQPVDLGPLEVMPPRL